MISEWGIAKQRISEEMTCKHERQLIASNPSKVSIMTHPGKIANTNKIYKTKNEFLDSDEDSLNTTGKSEEMRQQVLKENRKKLIAEEKVRVENLKLENGNDRSRDRSESFDKKKTIPFVPIIV